MSHNTPFHQDNTPPPPPPPFPPAPPRTPVPAWAWGLGVLMLGLLIAAILLLGGRDPAPEATPAPAVTVTQTATPVPVPTKVTKAEASPPAAELSEQTRPPAVMSEPEFIGFLHETFPILKTLPDEEIMSYSADTCDALDDGATPEDLLVKAATESISPEQAEALGGIVGASVSNYCPKYYNDFTEFLDAQAPAIGS